MMKSAAVLLIALLATPLASAQNLSGPYVGGYLAGGSGDAHWDISGGTTQDHSLSGGLGGVQGGYNWIVGSWLLGVQGDLGLGNLSGSSRCPNPSFECKTEWLGLLTVRGRVGPVFSNVSPYLTAGIASAGIRSSVESGSSRSEDTQGHAGWTAGAGVTGLIGGHITWQAEYLHVDVRSVEHVLNGVTNQIKATADMIRIGVHYKFF